MSDAPLTTRDAPHRLGERAQAGVTPWLVIALGATAYAASVALRDDALPSTGTLTTLAALLTAASLAVALARRGSSGRRQLALAITALVLVCGAIAAPATTRGLTSVTMPAVVLVAAYAGLTLPRSGPVAAALLAGVIGLHVAHPLASTLDAASLVAIVAVGWWFGRFSGNVHMRARRLAMRLARTDRLVHTLNRRGFTEELAYRLAHAAPGDSVAVMVLDLIDFKSVNERLGASAGDELLEQVGNQLASTTPADAIAGRLGSDEFAVAVTGRSDQDAIALAHQLQRAVSALHPARIGVASAQHTALSVSDLLRSADGAARKARQADAGPVQHLVAAQTSSPNPDAELPPAPLLTYARLRALGGRPTKPNAELIDGRAQRDGFLWLASAGLAVWLAYVLQGAETSAAQVVVYGGPVWLAACVAAAAHGAMRRERPVRGDVMVLAAIIASTGIAFAAFAGGGLSSPVVGGFYLMALVAAALGGTTSGLISLAIVTAGYAGLVAAAPGDQTWAIPFQLAMLAGAYALGRVSRGALDAITQEWLRIARTDLLTGLLNRFGFAEELAQRIERAPHGTRLAILTFDLDDFRAVNDRGYQAGDAVLRSTAEALVQAAPEALIARRGADEFMIAVEVDDPAAADQLLPRLQAAAAAVHPVSGGVGIYPDDATEMQAVERIADLRARHSKLDARATGVR